MDWRIVCGGSTDGISVLLAASRWRVALLTVACVRLMIGLVRWEGLFFFLPEVPRLDRLSEDEAG